MTNTLSFVVPEGMKGKTFVILYWDAAAKGGLGEWVEIPANLNEDGIVQSQLLKEGEAALKFIGTFVLAAK